MSLSFSSLFGRKTPEAEFWAWFQSNEECMKHIAFLMLDQTIGEFDVETKVGFIEVRPIEAAGEYKKHKLAALADVFDRFLET
jgi:hypothetical protein